MCYSRMGVKTGHSGAQLLPFERLKLCLRLGIHFVKVDRGVALCVARLYKKAPTVFWLGLFCIIGSLAVCYSRMGKPHTTIAANTFHC